MMSKQYKLHPATIWNGENKSFIYTVFFKERLTHVLHPQPPFRDYSGKKWPLLVV